MSKSKSILKRVSASPSKSLKQSTIFGGIAKPDHEADKKIKKETIVDSFVTNSKLHSNLSLKQIRLDSNYSISITDTNHIPYKYHLNRLNVDKSSNNAGETNTTSTNTTESISPPISNYKIITYNVNGLRACNTNLNGGLIQFLCNHEPDILCLQEIKCDIDQIPFAIPNDYYISISSSQTKKGYSGTLVLSREKPLNVEYKRIAENDEGRVIVVELSKFYLINTYIPNSGSELERLDYRVNQWDKQMHSYVRELSNKKPVIWAGDLNVAHLDHDVYDPVKTKNKASGFTDRERESFGLFLVDFVDCYRYLYPDEKELCYSWWSNFAEAFKKNRGWRLDYFVLSPELKSHIIDVFNMRDLGNKKRGSDHCPVALYLKF